MFYQIFFHRKWSDGRLLLIYKHGIYELPHELPRQSQISRNWLQIAQKTMALKEEKEKKNGNFEIIILIMNPSDSPLPSRCDLPPNAKIQSPRT